MPVPQPAAFRRQPQVAYYAAPLTTPLRQPCPPYGGRMVGVQPASGQRILAPLPAVVQAAARMPVPAPLPVEHCAAAWRDDGSDAVKNLPDGVFTISGQQSLGSPVNALCTTSLSSGQYFEVTCQELSRDGPFIGVGKLEFFGRGYTCRGLLFGGPGNLSNGASALKTQFGVSVRKGSVIGILVEMTDDVLILTVYQNGRCLGPAFEARRSEPSRIFPLVQAKRDGDTFRIDFKPAPASRSREPEGQRSGVEGVWQITQLLLGPELREYPLRVECPVSLRVQGTGTDQFDITVKAVNTMNFFATSQPDPVLAPFDALTVRPGLSTQVMGPEALLDVESQISGGLKVARKWILSRGTLLISGPSVELSCCAAADACAPVDTESV
mmetsp:Transcript_35174/g.81065  ORF Transcript_35174/g.81065 Transcript_35174/m.81065 type:complete len:383 (+) Transcript_35174:41-1189(+)